MGELMRKQKTKQTDLHVSQPMGLMEFLLQKMGGMSRTSVKSLLSHRQVQVNNRVETQYNYALSVGDKVVVLTSAANMELIHPKLRIVFEDND